ncbi:MAG: bestrophin family ion channel, partial [Bacteroidia bacterium]
MLLNKRIPLKYIFNSIKKDVVYIVGVSLLINSIILYNSHLLPEIPVAIPAFLGTAISLLLSFKLNQAYDRWWEARKIWGEIVNDSRTLVVQLKSFLKPTNQAAIKQITFRQIAWCYALTQQLRKQKALGEIEKYFNENEFTALKKSQHIPLTILDLSTQQVSSLQRDEQLNLFHQTQIDNTYVRLTASMGKAERIKNTVFPKTYSLFTHSIIYIFIIILSISIAEIDYFYEIIMVTVIAIPFLLLERTSEQIQDPFENRPTDTPITKIAQGIEL